MIYHNGIQIIECRWLQPKSVRYQFRFPRSKKKRIRNKWAKRNENYKTKQVEEAIIWDDKCIVSSNAYKLIMESL